MGAPVGPTGCEGGGHKSAQGPEWFVGAAFGMFEADVSFGDGRDVEIEQRSVSASFGRRIGPHYSVRVAAGAVLDGELELGDRRWDIDPGWLLSVGASRRWTFGDRYFATGSLSFAASRVTSQEEGGSGSQRVRALDLRLGAIAGITVADYASPYLLARVFGGPVSWRVDGEAITGSDKHKFQLGAGASVTLGKHVSALIDISVLGERGTSLALMAMF